MQMLEKHFAIAFASPDGIKKLRELILTLAMQGKLVPHDPHDLPASELLKSIEAEKKRLVKEGEIKQPKPLPNITPEEMPYSLPECWEWVRLNDVLDVRDGTHDTPKYVDVGFPLITSKNLYTGKLSFEDVKYISTEDHSKISDRSKVDVGDILFAMIGSIGNPVIVDSDEEFSIKNVALFKFYQTGRPDNRFLHFFLIYAQENMKATSSGAVQSFVSLGFLRNYLFPLPPLAEQRRIVVKIDQLMARCDELEKLRVEREQKRLAVHTAALNRLITAPESNDLNTAWRFITQHFGELYSVKENVTELRKAVLQLAVMGKLVPQDPHDQPASELLKEIEREKKQLVKEGKIKPSKLLQENKSEAFPHQLPKGWEWVRICSVFNTTSGNTFDAGLEKEKGAFAYVKVGDMNLPGNKFIITTSSRFIDPDEKMSNWLIPTGSIIFPKRGGAIATNKKRIVNNPIFVDLNTMAITPMKGVSTDYAYMWLLTIDLALLNTGTSVPQINHKDIDPLPFPLPPLAEQRRIVTKIDQLMALCDKLEQQIDAAIRKQSALLNAVMARV
jgi:type I restriction enzyme S subunit